MLDFLQSEFSNKSIKAFLTLPSTQTFAKEWAKNRPPEGSFVLTAHQTAGYGQTQSDWHTNAHQNITLSAIYYPRFLSSDRIMALNMMTSLAVADTLQQFNIIHSQVKWPNDILVQNQKIAGILIHNALTGKQITASIIGIGLNVNQTLFPYLPQATSMTLQHPKTFKLEQVINILLKQLDLRYHQLQLGQYAALKKAYLEQLYLFNSPHVFYLPSGKKLPGKIIDIADDGQLILDTEKGRTAFRFKEIKFTP